MNVTAHESLQNIASVIRSVAKFDELKSSDSADENTARGIEEWRDMIRDKLELMSTYEIQGVHQLVAPLRLANICRGTER